MFPALVLDTQALEHAVARLQRAEAFAYDVETVGPRRGHPVYNEVTWISLACDGWAAAIPMGHPNGDVLLTPSVRRKDRNSGKFVVHPPVYDAPPPQLEREQVFEALAPLFASDRLKLAHNQIFDMCSIYKYLGALPQPPYLDTIVALWLLDENQKKLGLKDAVTRRYGVVYDKEEIGKCVERHALSTVGLYAYLDAKYDYLIGKRLGRAIQAAGLSDVLALEMDLLPVLADMRLHGAYVDADALAQLDEVVTKELHHATEHVYASAGRQFNLNSTPQKQQVLYGRRDEGGQGLAPLMLTDGGKAKDRRGEQLSIADYSTKAEALEPYADNPVVTALLEYQKVEKLESTYVRAYRGTEEEPGALINGRIHTDFVQYGTRTGRFSSRKPNLQNVPRPGSHLATQVRSLFVAPGADWKLVVADYGQIELRVLAHYLGTGALFDGFHQGVDAHTATAALIFGVAWDDVTKEQRQVAKAINFAIVFGAGPATVASMAKVSLKHAKDVLRIHERSFPEIYEFKDAVVRTCRRRDPPHIKTLLGRVRRLPEIRYRDPGMRSLAERQAVNSLIQGSAGDLIKLSMVRLHPRLHSGMKLVLTVHDELVVESPAQLADQCSDLMREAMLGPGIQKLMTVPLTSNVAICDSWAQAK